MSSTTGAPGPTSSMSTSSLTSELTIGYQAMVVTIVLLVVYSALTVVFYRQRQEPFIASRVFPVSLVVNIMVVATMALHLACQLTPVQYPCWLAHWTFLVVHITVASLNVRTFILYFRLKLANEVSHNWVLHLTSRRSSAVTTTDSTRQLLHNKETSGFYASHKTAISVRNIVAYLLVMVIPMTIVSLVFTILYHGYGYECKLIFAWQMYMYTHAFVLFIEASIQVLVLYLLRNLTDAYFIKKEIYYFSIIGVLTYFVYVAVLAFTHGLDLPLNFGISIVFTFEVFSVNTLIPLYLCWRDRRDRRYLSQVGLEKTQSLQHEFRMVLVDTSPESNLSGLFEEYLIKELSVENFVFYKAVDEVAELLRLRQTRPTAMERLASMLDGLVRETATTPINVDSDTRSAVDAAISKYLRSENEDSVSVPDDEKSGFRRESALRSELVESLRRSQEVVFRLMFRDSFMRFRKTPEFKSAVGKLKQRTVINDILLETPLVDVSEHRTSKRVSTATVQV